MGWPGSINLAAVREAADRLRKRARRGQLWGVTARFWERPGDNGDAGAEPAGGPDGEKLPE